MLVALGTAWESTWRKRQGAAWEQLQGGWGDEVCLLGHVQAAHRVSAKKAGKHLGRVQGRERWVCPRAGIYFMAKCRLIEGKPEFLGQGHLR